MVLEVIFEIRGLAQGLECVNKGALNYNLIIATTYLDLFVPIISEFVKSL